MSDKPEFSFAQLQREHAPWEQHNFGIRPSWHPLLGIVEEIGELAHAHLKAEQGIRGTPEQLRAEKIDAVADAIVFLTSYCNLEGIDIGEAVESVWNEVKKRDWKKFPKDGLTE
jgi:NTP pyrophosphatase (non-canonical NTP hydrolase)